MKNLRLEQHIEHVEKLMVELASLHTRVEEVLSGESEEGVITDNERLLLKVVCNNLKTVESFLYLQLPSPEEVYAW